LILRTPGICSSSLSSANMASVEERRFVFLLESDHIRWDDGSLVLFGSLFSVIVLWFSLVRCSGTAWLQGRKVLPHVGWVFG
jgi:hypothetical protein